MVHRDLKLDNLLVDEKSRLVISDFGKAIILDETMKVPYNHGENHFANLSLYVIPNIKGLAQHQNIELAFLKPVHIYLPHIYVTYNVYIPVDFYLLMLHMRRLRGRWEHCSSCSRDPQCQARPQEDTQLQQAASLGRRSACL